MNSLLRSLAVALPLFAFASPPSQTRAPSSPAQVAQSLLDADRAFSASARSTDMISALSAMWSDGVLMPAPVSAAAPKGLLVGKAAVVAAMTAVPDATTSQVSWTPIRVGISADGQHGFSFGFMTQRKPDSTRVALKYMAYWVRERGVWRVAAYKRSRAAGPATDTTMMPPALPAAITTAVRAAKTIAALRRAVMDAESSFSAEAQRVGLGNAFATFGTADAVNMGGAASASYIVSAASIAALVAGGDMAASRVHWGADTALVASSGDLGITFGLIKSNTPPADGKPESGSAFFTIWRRVGLSAPWRYVAE